MADILIRITDAMLEGKGVEPLDDIPGLSADEMKAKFDEIVKTVIIPAFNDNMDEIARYIYVDPVSGNAYLTVDSLIDSYDRIKSATQTDADKTPNVLAIKDMNITLKGLINSLDNEVDALDAAINDDGTGIKARLDALETQGFIVFDKNDGTDMPDKKSIKCTFNYTDNTAVIPSTAPTYTMAGYTFLGWAESRSAVTADYQTGDTISNLDEHSYGNMVILNAVWQEDTP